MSTEKIKATYEQLAESYDALIDHKPHNAYYDRPNTLSLLPDVTGKKVLDAACGPGKYAEILLSQGAQVTGFDLSPKMVALAQQRNGDQGHFYEHNLAMPLTSLENESFDIVLCALALHYLEDWTATVQEFHRVLKPKGTVVISIEHPFFEHLYFKSKKYFQTEAVQTKWNGFGKRVTMHSYRRSLGSCLSPFTENGFYIDTLLEPKPVPAFEQLDRRHYKELNAFPAFMCIRAVKK